GNRRAFSGIAGNLMNQLQFCTRLNVEKKNARIQRIADLVRSLSHTCKNDLRRRPARAQHTKQFAAGNDVETGSPLGKPTQNIDVGVCFDRITDQMRYGLESFVENAD